MGPLGLSPRLGPLLRAAILLVAVRNALAWAGDPTQSPSLGDVLFMSGYPDPSVVDPAVLEMSGGFLQKPFSAAALTERVRQELDRP